jgi:hypothetical protein
VWFTWLEEEGEGALLSINDLVNVVRNANTKELKALKIIRDKCQQTAYNKFKIGDKSLTYIHIACGDLMENTEIPFETNTSKNIDWNAKLDANAIYIDPSEVSKVSTVTKDGTKYVRYQFHELKYSEKPFELPQLTENILFHFLVLESEAKDFEEYLYPKSISDTIKIFITRINTGTNSTTGTLRTDDGTIIGYTVEPPRGSDNESKTSCTDNEIPFDCHCIVEGVYNFEINTKVYDEGDIKKHSLRITTAVPDGRTGVLVHGGRDDAKGWSQGCILPMPNDPEKNSELSSLNRKNTKVQSVNFTIEIIDWVKQREIQIKKENKVIKKVVKQIIIIKTF